MARIGALLVALSLLAGAPAGATIIIYSVTMDGGQEVPAPGDPDGTASGTITPDDVTRSISWSFTYANIAAPNAMHIHGPGGSAGSAVGVFVGLGVATSGGAGTLISGTTTSTANVTTIFANPTGFYVNIHNVPFGGGAVRGQLGTVVPEPGTLLLFGAGLAGLAVRRRGR